MRKLLDSNKFHNRFTDYFYCNAANFGGTSYIKLFLYCALHNFCSCMLFELIQAIIINLAMYNTNLFYFYCFIDSFFNV